MTQCLNTVIWSVLLLITSFCGSVQAADLFVSTPVGCSHPKSIRFGETAFLGCTTFSTTSQAISISGIRYTIRECSPGDAAAAPLSNFTISMGIPNGSSTPGTVELIDGEHVVTFPVRATIPANSIIGYNIFADVGLDDQGNLVNNQCIQLIYRRGDVGTRSGFSVTGNFPIRHGANTMTRAIPHVYLQALGATTGRVRTESDDVFLVNVFNDSSSSRLWVKGLRLNFTGSVLPTNVYPMTFSIVDQQTGFVVATGNYQSSGNVVWNQIVGGISYEHFELLPFNIRSYVIRVNSSHFNDSPGSDTLSVGIVERCDMRWDTALGNEGGPGLCLQPWNFPLTTTVSYE